MGAFLFSECILVSSEVSHLIATLVKRLWLSYTTGLHIPATRWIGILPEESPDRCGTCAIYRTANLPMVLNIITPAHIEYHQ